MSDSYSQTQPVVFVNGFEKIATISTIEGEEGFSKPFSFTLHVNSNSSFATISNYIGHSVGLKIDFDSNERYIHGVITQIEQNKADVDFSARESKDIAFTGNSYTLKIESKLVFLQKNITCQVHHAQKAIDIVCDILKKNDIPYDSSRLSVDDSFVQARVQYNQSDYDFISEILQSIGVFYCFEHHENAHRMIFYDNVSQLYDRKEVYYTAFRIYDSYSMSELRQAKVLVPTSVRLNGYHFENSKAFSTETVVKLKEQKNINICHHTDSFINNQKQLDRQLKYRAGQFSANSSTGKIISNSPSIIAGQRFTLNANGYAGELEIDYFISELRMSASNYQSKFISDKQVIVDSMFSAELTIHPYTEGACYYPPFKVCRQLISGNLSAFVAGAEKEDIHTDEYGRIQIRFLWQPEKYGHEFSAQDYCWARVSQVWSGRDMGGQFIPRVGSEVLVSFLNGDPSYPVVTGCVFNGNYKPPFNLENKKSQACSGIISHILNDNSETAGHQLCFQDQKGEEYVLLQSKKDLFFKTDNDATLTIKNGDYVIAVEKGKITISSAGGININSKKEILLSVEGSHINIEPEKIKISGSVIEISAEGEATLSARGKAEVSAEGMVNIHGAEIKLN